jgi:hypothetical protein
MHVPGWSFQAAVADVTVIALQSSRLRRRFSRKALVEMDYLAPVCPSVDVANIRLPALGWAKRIAGSTARS